MLSAIFAGGEIQRIYYYDQAKNDGYPVVQLSEEDRLLKGYNWQPEKRPEDRNAVTPLSLRPSQRRMYSARPRAKYIQTDIYFPGYMGDVYHDNAPYEYYERGKDITPLHDETRALLVKMLKMLGEKGEKETFAFVKKEVLHK